jgi:hypothetical protein
MIRHNAISATVITWRNLSQLIHPCPDPIKTECQVWETLHAAAHLPVKPAVQVLGAAVVRIWIWSKKMTESRDMIKVHVNVEITAASLQTIVENVKRIAGRDEKGVYRVDTADKVSEMISRFLFENDFEGYVKDIENYWNLIGKGKQLRGEL